MNNLINNINDLINDADFVWHDGITKISYAGGQNDPHCKYNLLTLKGCCNYYGVDLIWLKGLKKKNIVKDIIVDDDNLIIKFSNIINCS
jgi:hypothetical protein